MINICGLCQHNKLKQNMYCINCVGNPKFVDNFKQITEWKTVTYNNGVSFNKDERDKRRKL